MRVYTPGRTQPWIKRFLEKYLSPAERLSEITFGLIMVLTVTSTIGIALPRDEAAIRVMIAAALGCNAAWGIVDGVMYVFTGLFDRTRYARLVSHIRTTADKNAALSSIEKELEPTIIWSLNEKERKRISAEVLKSVSEATPEEGSIMRDDVFGAFASFLLVFFAALPLVLPFFIIRDAWIAIRVSNLVAITMLFAIGYQWAQYTNTNRFRAGVAMVLTINVLSLDEARRPDSRILNLEG